MSDNVVSLVDKALERAVIRFTFTTGTPPVFDRREIPLSDEVVFCVRRPVTVRSLRIIVPGVLEADCELPPEDARKLPYDLKGGETFRVRNLRAALAKQMPALLAQKTVLAESKKTD